MNGLPARPGGKILRSAEAASWIDGYAFRDSARAEAEALLSTTRDVVERARAEGEAAGRKAGEAAAAALLMQTQVDVSSYLAGLEGRLADLALSIVRQVLASFDQAEFVRAVAAEAIAAFRDAEEVVVRVAPGLAASVEALLTASMAAGPRVRVEADPHLTDLQCIVTSPVASIDVGLDAQLGAIRSAMIGSGA